jgi:hypothetical protein
MHNKIFINIVAHSKLKSEGTMNRTKSLTAAATGVILTAFLIIMPACKNRGTAALKETPTSGNIRIDVDDSFQPSIEAVLDTFTALYPMRPTPPVTCRRMNLWLSS